MNEPDPPCVQAFLQRLLVQYLPAALKGDTYTDRLLCQAVLEAPCHGPNYLKKAQRQVVERFGGKENAFRNGPFNHLGYVLAEQTQSPQRRARFRQVVLGILDQPCSAEGAWMHPRGRFGPGFAVLLDSFQEEAVCLLLYAAWKRREDPDRADELEAKAVEQFRLHRQILRNPETGLWHNGRGWISGDPAALSPGAWSRGHGWLMRGCVGAIHLLPPGEKRTELESLFFETVETLLRLRNDDGCWPVLLNRHKEGSPSETSGSAMISSAILKAARIGITLPPQSVEAGRKALDTLLETCVDERGEIFGCCDGPGPLVDENPYLRGGFSGDSSHGAFALLEACLERQGFMSKSSQFSP